MALNTTKSYKSNYGILFLKTSSVVNVVIHKSECEVKEIKSTLPMPNPSSHVTAVGKNKANSTKSFCQHPGHY